MLDWPEWSDSCSNPVVLARPPSEDPDSWQLAVNRTTDDPEGWQYGTVFK